MLAVSAAKSVSWMRLRAAETFSEVVVRFETTLVKRFWIAPRSARLELTVARAASMVARAFCAPAAVLRSMVETPDPKLEVAAVLP